MTLSTQGDARPPLRNDPRRPRGVSIHPRNSLVSPSPFCGGPHSRQDVVSLYHPPHPPCFCKYSCRSAPSVSLRKRESIRGMPLKLDKSTELPSFLQKSTCPIQLWWVLTWAAQCSLLVPCNVNESPPGHDPSSFSSRLLSQAPLPHPHPV